MMTMMMKSNANAHFTPPPWGYSGASWLTLEVCHAVGRLLDRFGAKALRKPEYTVESYEPELQAKVANGYLEGKNI